MIIAYDINGNELGRYDNASDVWHDFPDAEIHNTKAIIKERSSD